MSADGSEAAAREQLGRNARNRRLELGRSQEDVAEAMQARGYRWHQATVYKVESATRALVVTEAAGLAAELGISLDELLLEGGGEAQYIAEMRVCAAHIQQTHDQVWESSQQMLGWSGQLRSMIANVGAEGAASAAVHAAAASVRDVAALEPEGAVVKARGVAGGSRD